MLKNIFNLEQVQNWYVSVFNGTNAEHKSEVRLAITKLTELNVYTAERERR